MLDVSEAILTRDGVLAGVNLAEVAAKVGVNRSLIYQYFGSGQELLRRALQRRLDAASDSLYPPDQPDRHPLLDVDDPPIQQAINDPLHVRLLALVHLDGYRDIKSLPRFKHSIELLKQEQEKGGLPLDIDPTALHVSLVSLYYGYGLFREKFAEEASLKPEELDTRVIDFYARIIAGIRMPQPKGNRQRAVKTTPVKTASVKATKPAGANPRKASKIASTVSKPKADHNTGRPRKAAPPGGPKRN